MEHIPILIFQMAVILICAKIFGELFHSFLKLPSVLGELLAGLIISPFALGGIKIGNLGPLFSFDVSHGNYISTELFFISQLAAVILLFEVGLETNRDQFKKYITPASLVALGGVVLPFGLGVLATILFGYSSFNSINELVPALFMGAMLTATSVGITARVLSDLGVLDNPEGSTIMAAAVLDDVLGIIVLAAVVGIAQDGQLTLSSLIIIFVKAVGFWLSLLVLGSILSKVISNFIMSFKVPGANISLSLALALLAASIAEHYFGLAMIIGSYTFGLALSGTDLKHHIEKPLSNINAWLVPVFFVVIGMQADFVSLWTNSGDVLSVLFFVITVTVFAILSKILGCGIPTLLIGFSRKQAWRIGVGMLPRGEIALIIAGIGMSTGVIGQELFGVSIIMIIVTTILAPVLLYQSYK
jgi:Kef-type K+ transport system membrane component KefB